MSYNEPPGYGNQPPGTPPPPPGYGGGQPNWGGQQPQGTSVLAIISLATGILGILCCTWFVFSIAAAVLGFLGKKEIDEGKKTGRGMAMAGLILGIVGIVLGVVMWVVLIASDNASMNYYSEF